jgi:hypothetical protein
VYENIKRAEEATDLSENAETSQSIARALFAGVLPALLAVAISGCGTIRAMYEKRFHTRKESEVHAISIPPDVDYVDSLDVGKNRRIYVSNRDLIFANGDRFFPLVVRGYPRVLGLSPNDRLLAFLEPAEFEMAADLYVFDIPARTIRRVTSLEDPATTLSVRTAKWYDSDTLYYLIGYRYGTVSRGGDLWCAKLKTLESHPIVRVVGPSKGAREIVEFEFVPKQKLIRYLVAQHDPYGGEKRKAHYCTLDGKPID